MAAVWHWLRPATGPGLRRGLAGLLLIMGLGRLGMWRTSALATALSMETYGLLLTGLGLALLATLPRRFGWPGRLVAGLAAVLLAGMAWDVGVWGVTALMEGWMAYCLAGECLSRHDC